MKLLDFFKSLRPNKHLMTMEDVVNFSSMRNLDDCKRYMSVMLDFYFDVIQSPEGRKATSAIEDDRNIWLQQIFSMGCHFRSLLDGVGYQRESDRLNPILDPDVLFTIARRIYESVVVFNTLFILPKDTDHQTILYNLFRAHGLAERLKDLDEDMRKHHPKRIAEEKTAIQECKDDILSCPLYARLDKETQNNIDNAFGRKFRYVFTEDNKLKFYQYEDAYKFLGVSEQYFGSIYSFFSLHGHPSYLSVCQFRDAFKNEYRADVMMAKHATQCALSFMSIFIVDYMKLNPEVKAMYDNLELPRKFAIGMYEDAMREVHKFR